MVYERPDIAVRRDLLSPSSDIVDNITIDAQELIHAVPDRSTGRRDWLHHTLG